MRSFPSVSEDEQTLDAIYNAAVDPSLWVDVMRRLMTITGGTGGVLMRADIEDGTGVAVVDSGDISAVESYFSHYAEINPLIIVDNPSSYVAGWKPRVLLDEQLIVREAFERSEYYNDFLRPLSAEWGMSIRLGLQGRDVASISIGRGFKYGRFDPSEVAVVEHLQPHLVRAYALSGRFASLQGVNAGLAAALDRSSCAMFLVDGDARILHANDGGERLLAKGDVLCASNGRLAAVDPRAAQPLFTSIARAASDDRERRGAGSLSLNAPGRRIPFTVDTSPLRLEQVSVFSRRSAVLVCITDPAAGAVPREVRLAEVFGLTAAESRLAIALVEGLSLRQASTRYNIAFNTARFQLASIFTKTRTHRQIDLVRLIMTEAEKRQGEVLSQ